MFGLRRVLAPTGPRIFDLCARGNFCFHSCNPLWYREVRNFPRMLKSDLHARVANIGYYGVEIAGVGSGSKIRVIRFPCFPVLALCIC